MRSVTIVGAGIQGIGIARTFKALGFEVRVFEKLDNIGGTWHSSNSYPDLATHAPMNSVLFADYPALPGFDNKKSIQRSDLITYLKSYIRHFNIERSIILNSKVVDITYDKSASTKCITIKFLNTLTNETSIHSSDFLIYTTNTTVPIIPDFKGRSQFRGKIIHTNQFTQEVCDEALANGRKILVVGGNKSAADVVQHLEKRAYKNYLWLFRRNSWGVNYDLGSKQKPGRVPWWRLLLFTYFLIYKKKKTRWASPLVFAIIKFLRIMICPFPESHALAIGWNGAVWRNDQLRILRNSKHCRGEIQTISCETVTIKERDSDKVISEKPDLIVCGTGFLQTKDVRVLIKWLDESYILHQENESYLFRNLVDPRAPRIVFLNSLISPGRITISTYLLSLWIYRYFNDLINSKYTKEVMRAEINDDMNMMKANDHHDYSVWKVFQRSTGLILQKNAVRTLSDLGLLTSRNLLNAFGGLTFDWKEPYLKKLNQFIDEQKKLPSSQAERRMAKLRTYGSAARRGTQVSLFT